MNFLQQWPLRVWIRILGIGLMVAGLGLGVLYAHQQAFNGESATQNVQLRLTTLNELNGMEAMLRDIQSEMAQAQAGTVHLSKWRQQWAYVQTRGEALNAGVLSTSSPWGPKASAFAKAWGDWQQAALPAMALLSAPPTPPTAPSALSLADLQTLQQVHKEWGEPLQAQTHLLFEALSRMDQGADSPWGPWLLAISLSALLAALTALVMIVQQMRRDVGADPKELVRITREIVGGNLRPQMKVRATGQHSVAENLGVILENLRSNQQLNQQRLWLDKGLALINDTVRNEYAIGELAQHICENLCTYLDLESCALYLNSFGVEDDSMIQRKALRLSGFHARDNAQPPERLSCGLQELKVAASLNRLLKTKELPPTLLSELKVTAQDGASHFVMVPLQFENEIRGTVVLKSKYLLPSQISDLMVPGSAAIGVAVESALNRETLMASLMDAQRLTNQLQSNHEKLQDSQAALKQQIHYVNDIFASMQSGLVIVDQQGKIKDINQTLLKMTGQTRDSLIDQHSSVLFEENNETLDSILQGFGQMLSRLDVQDHQAYLDLLAQSLLGCLLVDMHGHVIVTNSRATQILGFSLAEMDSMPLSQLVPTRFRSRHAEWVKASQADANLHTPGAGRSISMLTKDGQEIQVEISLINHQYQGQTVTLALLRQEHDLPWAVVNSATLQQLSQMDEDAMVTMLKQSHGEQTPVRITSSFILNASGLPEQTVINVHDVSSLLHKSQEIKAQHQLLEMTMDAMQDGVLRVDREGMLVSANPMALELLGLDKAQVLLSNIRDLFPGAQNGHTIQHWLPLSSDDMVLRLTQDAYLHTEEVQQLPVPLLNLSLDGHVLWATPTACELLGMGTPPQQSQNKVALHPSTTEQLQQLQQAAHPQASSWMQFTDITWRAGTAPSMRLPTLIIPNADSSDAQMLVWLIPEFDRLSAHTINEAHNVEWQILHPEGILIPALFTAAPLMDPYNRLTGAVITLKDMRELKEKEAEHLRMVQKMEQSQKLDALGQLAAGVAHDFNNLLGVIQNHAELVEMKVGPDSKATKNLSAILQATTRARDIVIKLNALGRENRENQINEVLQTFELMPLLHETQTLLQASLKGIEIAVESPEGNLPVTAFLKGDSGSLQQVMVNLCVNASHAIGENRGGRIVMQASTPDPDHVLIEVIDNGSGIPPEILTRIFEPFFTTKEVGKGTGLGLAMVRSIVTRMGGSIECHSEVDVGTNFGLLLPAKPTAD
jgi:PAS domain S-box-containing protein